MSLAQRVIADAEPAGVVRHNDRVAHEAVVTDRTPYARGAALTWNC